MSSEEPPGPLRDSRVQELVDSVLPEIERLVERSPLPRTQAGRQVSDTMVHLAVRWDSLHDPRDWFLETLAWRLRVDEESGSRS